VPDEVARAEAAPTASVARPESADAGALLPEASIDASLARARDIAERLQAARDLFGADVHTRVLDDTFVLAGKPAALLDRAGALLDRALPQLYTARFARHDLDPVTVLLFPTDEGYGAYVARFDGNPHDWGIFNVRTHVIAAKGSGGDAFLPTLLHEVVHPIMEADFPRDQVWFEEGVASLFEAPMFAADGSLHVVPKNRRQERLRAAFRSPKERDEVTLPKLFAMDAVTFNARIDGGKDQSRHSRNYALARSFCAWLEEKGKLWEFYRTWRDGVVADERGEKAFERVIGMTVEGAEAPWREWATQ
jgi:hypothetical protein